MTAETIEWGVLITLPTGATDVEVGGDRSHAIMMVNSTNRAAGGDAAKLVYRSVKLGDWSTEVVGEQWAIRNEWPDGHIEVRPTDSRAFAEAMVRQAIGRPEVAELVSRTVVRGDWWLATGEVA